ncbi:hypothetical protein [Haloarcula salina]|uniref:hypothetical protein n=1 Tax=Haloarcula salina TaxID=1429914 RepID=UPI001F50D0CF|nr:hypothetical protein [Haloarcula salina]
MAACGADALADRPHSEHEPPSFTSDTVSATVSTGGSPSAPTPIPTESKTRFFQFLDHVVVELLVFDGLHELGDRLCRCHNFRPA